MRAIIVFVLAVLCMVTSAPTASAQVGGTTAWVTVSGYFKTSSPCDPCDGLGTSTFRWGTPAAGSFMSQLSFVPGLGIWGGLFYANDPVFVQKSVPFIAGVMYYANGGSVAGVLPEYVTLVIETRSSDPAFDKNEEFRINITNTPGTSLGADANADKIAFNEYPNFESYAVHENRSTYVNVWAAIHSLDFAGWGEILDPTVGFLTATGHPEDYTRVQASQPIPLDVRPESTENPISLTARGLLPVAVLSTQPPLVDVDASQIDASSVTIGDPRLSGRVSPLQSRLDDVDGDGDADLLLLFSIPELVANGAIDANTDRLLLKALDTSGGSIVGTDVVRVVPKQ